jgi:DNA-binding MarR family transcriptional regulator
VSYDEPVSAATAVRRGVTSLSRRLRMERAEPVEPLLPLSVLAHLNRRGPMTPGELAGAERVQPQSLTRALASLEAAGRILRQPDPGDGRRSLLAITEAGRLALARDMRQRDAWLAAAMAEHLTPVERELLRLAGELLERLADVTGQFPQVSA